jgi:GT2 family glycosyltransferase
MTREPTATVVVVSRDRWSLAPSTLERLLARTDPRHPVVVVDGRAPRHVATVFDSWAASGRIRVARRARHLGGNEARNIGADGVRTEWIAFVENDVVLNPGWLEDLLQQGAVHDAASVYPAYLWRGGDDPIVHGLGADLQVFGAAGERRLREHQFHVGTPWREIDATLEPVERLQAEPHALVIRRDLLESMGGFDEELLS